MELGLTTPSEISHLRLSNQLIASPVLGTPGDVVGWLGGVQAQDYIPYPSETQYIGFMRANYLDLFPKLLDQSQLNRRARSLRLLVEQFRRYWIVRKGWHLQTQFLLDTKPVPAMG